MIETRKLGQGEVRVGAIALGAMAFAGWYDTRDDEAGVLAIHRALDAGITLIDTAEAYGNGKSEGLVGRAVRDRRDRAVVATKASKGSPAYLREAVDRSLKHLGLDHIDLYYLHRVDPETPLEESLAAIAEYRDAGKIAHVGISEVGVAEIERARELVPVAAVQNRYNLEDRRHDQVVDHCEREGLVFVPFFPLRGDGGQTLTEIAEHHGATASQVKLAWLLRRSPAMLPIPGTLSLAHLGENLAALEIELSDAEYEALL
jgi:pyridoxine 4-dehydrogenase